jgi:hypothetical protein
MEELLDGKFLPRVFRHNYGVLGDDRCRQQTLLRGEYGNSCGLRARVHILDLSSKPQNGLSRILPRPRTRAPYVGVVKAGSGLFRRHKELK